MAEIFLANASTAPGADQITVAMDTVTPYLRTHKRTPPRHLGDDPAQRLELLSTYFPGEVQASPPDPGRPAAHRPAPGELCRRLGLRARLAVVRARRQRWQPEPSRIFKTMRVFAPGLELDPLLRGFADLDVCRVVHAPGRA